MDKSATVGKGEPPSLDAFKVLLKKTQRNAKTAGMKPSDIVDAIQTVRAENKRARLKEGEVPSEPF